MKHIYKHLKHYRLLKSDLRSVNKQELTNVPDFIKIKMRRELSKEIFRMREVNKIILESFLAALTLAALTLLMTKGL